MPPDAPGRPPMNASASRRWEEGPWQPDVAHPAIWLGQFWYWLLTARGNRRRQLTILALALGAAVLTSGCGAWALAKSHWLAAAWLWLGLVEVALGVGEELATLDLQDLNVPKDMKPADVMRMTPPGSVWYRAARRVVRLHRAYSLLAFGLWLLGLAVVVSM